MGDSQELEEIPIILVTQKKAQPTLHPGVKALDGFAFRYLSELTSFRSPWLRRYLMCKIPQAAWPSSSLKGQYSLLGFCSEVAQPLSAVQACKACKDQNGITEGRQT